MKQIYNPCWETLTLGNIEIGKYPGMHLRLSKIHWDKDVETFLISEITVSHKACRSGHAGGLHETNVPDCCWSGDLWDGCWCLQAPVLLCTTVTIHDVTSLDVIESWRWRVNARLYSVKTHHFTLLRPVLNYEMFLNMLSIFCYFCPITQEDLKCEKAFISF